VLFTLCRLVFIPHMGYHVRYHLTKDCKEFMLVIFIYAED